MRVWDLMSPTCLQIMKFRESDFPRKQNLSSIYMDSETGRLILTSNRVGVLKIFERTNRTSAHPESDLILLVAYSAPFECLVTVGNDSSVAVWKIETNELINEFKNLHETENRYGLIKAIRVTSATLDPTGKRLITAGRDGSIKVWNFYLGICLRSFHAKFRVLSLTTEGFEIFAGGSLGQIISFYDDGDTILEGAEWKRVHKQSVISMACCSKNILATASCDGEIVAWLWKNGDVKLHMMDEADASNTGDEVDSTYLAKSEVNKRKRCGISQILYLSTRQMEHSVGNLVSCGVDGKIRFWNVISTNKVNQWRLLSRFKAVFRPYDAILCIETDQKNDVLFSGDTQGYLRTYDLEDYYSSFGSVPANSRESKQHHMSYYPFLRMQKLIEKNHREYSKFDADGGAELGYAPILLNCYRAHVRPILKISYCNEQSMVITAGKKGSVRLWTLAGKFLRELGLSEVIQKPLKHSARKHHLPKDIQAVASALTLQVLNSGWKPHWERGIQAIRRCRLVYEPEELKEIPLKWMERKEMTKRDAKHINIEKLTDLNLKSELEKRLVLSKDSFTELFLKKK
ncbi:WD repeat-containing protein on Y chromosome-like [Parasteatoda tepidariorum]|uniref:WD repeat-containing protein on Y chromosome-like n=1 Tax=Parasteatoda tepidariorum TaxID=114398 RepID=UPI0039BD1CEE